MSTIPESAFAECLRQLTHEEFQSFVAELWSLRGWETSITDSVVTASKGDREQRLLVLPVGRLARFRFEPPPAETFDRAVSPALERSETVTLDRDEVSLVDARDLRHRLVYGSETTAAEGLWTSYFDVELRDSTWERRGRSWTWGEAALASLSLVLVITALVVLVAGIPFLESDPPPSEATTSAFDGGLDAEIDVGPPEQTDSEPSDIAWGETLYVGSETGTFAALDAETGEQVWQQRLGNQVRSPLVVNGTVYVRSAIGVHALDAVTGETRWTYENLSIDWANYEFFRSTSTRQTVVDDTVYVSDSEALIALDAQTGAELWRVPTPQTVTGAPTVFDDTVYLSSVDGILSAYEAETGKERWTVENNQTTFHASTVVRDNGRENASLLVAGTGALYEFDAETGEEGWRFTSMVSGEFSPPLVLENATVLQTERHPGNETNASAERSQIDLGSGTDERDGMVYLADARSYVYALDAATGERQSAYQDPATIFRYPVLGGPTGNESAHTLYVVGDSPLDGPESMLIAINTSVGDERWRFERQNETLGVPTVVEETLYVGTDNGEVLTLDTATRTERWRAEAFDDPVSGAIAVVTEPLAGDSVDSRIRLGVEGHHDWFASGEEAGGDASGGLSVIETNVTATAAASERVTARVTLANTGENPDNTSVTVAPNWGVDTETLETEVDLEPGEARELEFTFAAPSEPGNYTSAIQVGEDETEFSTAVTERPEIDVVSLDDPDTVWQEDETEIIASIRNPSDVEATTPVALAFGGEVVDSTQRTVGANETVSVTFSLSPDNAPAGEYNYSVATNSDVESASIEVLAVDRREDALPIVTQVFGLTLLLSGLALGWRVLTDVRGPLLRREETASEQ